MSTQPKDVARHFRRRRYRAVLTGLIAGISSWISLFLLLGWVLPSRELTTGSIALAIGLIAYCRPLRTRGIVLWLRRFHLRRSRRILFDHVLKAACSQLAQPITIQDSSFRTSQMSALFTSLWAFPLIVFGFFLLFIAFILVYLLTVDIIDVDTGLSGVFFVCIFLSVGLAVGVWVYASVLYHALSSVGYITLTEQQAIQSAQGIIRGIKYGESLQMGFRILKCGNSFWRDIVLLFIECADLVVIDRVCAILGEGRRSWLHHHSPRHGTPTSPLLPE
jgi:hypothetical protein